MQAGEFKRQPPLCIALRLIRSTVSYNSADNGGGIFNDLNLVSVNSTISLNDANTNGGGVFNFSGIANVYNTSIIFNGADADADPNGGSAGGVYNSGATGAVFNLRNTLLAGNNVSGAPVYDECFGSLNSYGRNLIGLAGEGGVCTISQAGPGSSTVLNSPYTIGQLQNNGGPTWTHALLRGSNAIDGGDPTGGCVDDNAQIIPTDQRGAPRVFGVHCDIGAFEYRTPLYLPLIRR